MDYLRQIQYRDIRARKSLDVNSISGFLPEEGEIPGIKLGWNKNNQQVHKHVEHRVGWRTWLLLLLLLPSVARQATAPAYTMGLALGIDETAARTRLALVLRLVRQKRKVRLTLSTRLFPDKVGCVPRWGHGFGVTPAERRPAGALDAVLVPLNPGIPGIRPSSTTRAHVCRTHFSKSWWPLLLLSSFLCWCTVMIG